jgi:hypothetical protein
MTGPHAPQRQMPRSTPRGTTSSAAGPALSEPDLDDRGLGDRGLGELDVQEQFLSLVLADQDLVDAEFDALIAEQFAEPPARPAGRVRARPAHPAQPRAGRHTGAPRQAARHRVIPRSAGFRQRAPPNSSRGMA